MDAKEVKRVYGIDLGTTYSCIAVVDDTGKPRILSNPEGEQITPSVVYYESDSNVVVGKYAKRESLIFPDRVASFVKRYMGRPGFSYAIEDKSVKPEEVSAAILRKLVEGAAQSGEEITDVVITCPAYFGNSEREATRMAGEIADLTVRHIFNEPTAAATFYGLEKAEGKEAILVYDFGGGTFDVTLIAVDEAGVRVLHTDGDRELGGKDIDNRVIAYLADEFMKQSPEEGDPRDDLHSLQSLAESAEELKKALSTTEKSQARVQHGGAMTFVEMTRETLEQLISDLVGRTIEITQRLVAAVKEKGYGKIDRILLVGGSSRIPYVAVQIEAALGIEPSLFEPDLAVVKGAALIGLKVMTGEGLERYAQDRGVDSTSIDPATLSEADLEEIAGKLPGDAPMSSAMLRSALAKQIVNKCSKGFGIAVVVEEETMKEKEKEEVSFIIHAQTTVPCKQTQRFGTHRANSPSVAIRVYEQRGDTESPRLEDNTLIASGDITGLTPGLPKGSPIDVTFEYRDDGTLAVHAIEPSSGQSRDFEAERPGVMTKEEAEEAGTRLSNMEVE